MAPSPSSSLNTPGGVGATPSPQQEDQAYRDKVRQLSKYIEPLRRMIAKMSSEGSKDTHTHTYAENFIYDNNSTNSCYMCNFSVYFNFYKTNFLFMNKTVLFNF